MVAAACFGARVSVMFHHMFVSYTFSSVSVDGWSPFGKKLPARLAICSHCLLSICIFYLFPILAFRAGFDFDCSRFCSLRFYYFWKLRPLAKI